MNRRSTRFRRPVAVAAAVVTSVAMFGSGPNPAGATHTTVTAVKGSAFGYHADNIKLFGGAQADTGPTPTVALAADASNSPRTATASTGLVKYGPAIMFTSDRIDVSTSGSLGTTGSVTTSTSIQNINKAVTQPTYTGSEVLTATTLASTCTASGTGVTGSTTITDGTLQTSDGNPDVDGDETIVVLPVNPAPNTTYTGVINSVGDSFRYVFNEQIVNADGSLTVNAAHQYLLGPTATGDLILGQSVCGVTTMAGPNTAPVAANDAYNTAYNTALNVPAPGVLTNDYDPEGDALTAGMYTQPANGTVAGNMDGSFTYTPNAGFFGDDTFTYMAHDSHGAMSNTAKVTITVGAPPLADLVMGVISDLPDPVAPLGTVTYTIPVTNNGPSGASDVTLQGTLSGVRGASVTSTSATAGTCTVLKGKTKGVSCNLGAIANGDTVTVTVVVAAPRKEGVIILGATVSSPNDTVTGNNSGSASTDVVRPSS